LFFFFPELGRVLFYPFFQSLSLAAPDITHFPVLGILSRSRIRLSFSRNTGDVFLKSPFSPLPRHPTAVRIRIVRSPVDDVSFYRPLLMMKRACFFSRVARFTGVCPSSGALSKDVGAIDEDESPLSVQFVSTIGGPPCLDFRGAAF